MKIVIRGDRALNNRMLELKRVEVHGVVKRFALSIFRQAQQWVPVDIGTLRQSGEVREDTSSRRNRPVWTIVYTAYYAIFVHEDLTKMHGSDYNLAYKDQIAGGLMRNRGDQQRARWLQLAMEKNAQAFYDAIRKVFKR